MWHKVKQIYLIRSFTDLLMYYVQNIWVFNMI